MRRTFAANATALLLSLGATVILARPPATVAMRPLSEPSTALASELPHAVLSDGRVAIVDATRSLVPLRHYRRVVTTNLVADRLLVELCSRDRIAAVSRAATERQRDGFRYQGLVTVDGFGPAEAVVALHPDLVVTNSFGMPGYAQRLRDAGVEVFDLGELRGVRSVRMVALALGELLEVRQRASELVRAFETRLHNVSLSLGDQPRRRGMFLSTLGPDLLGGTQGTGYHDILTAGGLVDVAAEHYRDWPSYSAEQVLALAPDILVTREGFADAICRYPGMRHLPPCQSAGRIVELPAELLDEPGLSMLDAAEMLFRLVYGKHD